jgi:carbamoylphosphate synthase large subunit
MIVKDLDVLRPESKFVKIGDKEIDVSFIPCGITFEIESIMRELSNYTEDIIRSDSSKTKEAFQLTIKLCSTFCEHKYPELDEQWFMENTDAGQIQAFATAIKDALVKAYNGIEANPKNRQAPKKKT